MLSSLLWRSLQLVETLFDYFKSLRNLFVSYDKRRRKSDRGLVCRFSQETILFENQTEIVGGVFRIIVELDSDEEPLSSDILDVASFESFESLQEDLSESFGVFCEFFFDQNI